MRKSFELLDDAFELSALDGIVLLPADEIVGAVESIARAVGWWRRGASATIYAPTMQDGAELDSYTADSAWAGLLCSSSQFGCSLALGPKPSRGPVSSGEETIVVPLQRNRLVLFNAVSLCARLSYAAAPDGTVLWLICVSEPSGELQ